MNWRENMSRSKEVLGAHLRQGAHELGAVLYPPGTAAQPPEYGLAFTKPASLVVDGLRPDKDAAPAKDEPAPSVLDSYLQNSQEHESHSHELERDDPAMERD